MIDEFFQSIAEELHQTMNPAILQYISDTFQNNVFQKMTPEELQINCIKVILEILTVIILFWISNRKRRSKRKRRAVATQKKQEPEKKFKPKVWTPDGYYYDDKKEKWIDPDF